jgi:hypothetical protein
MGNSQQFEQASGPKVDVESFVLYRSPYGDSYHMNAECATDPDIPSALDGAQNLLERVEMYRVREIEEEISSDNLCESCSQELRRVLGFG